MICVQFDCQYAWLGGEDGGEVATVSWTAQIVKSEADYERFLAALRAALRHIGRSPLRGPK